MKKFWVILGLLILVGPVVFFAIYSYRVSKAVKQWKESSHLDVVYRDGDEFRVHWITDKGKVALAIIDDCRFHGDANQAIRSEYYQVSSVSNLPGTSLPVVFHPEKGRIDLDFDGHIYQVSGPIFKEEEINVSPIQFQEFLNSGEEISITGLNRYLRNIEQVAGGDATR